MPKVVKPIETRFEFTQSPHRLLGGGHFVPKTGFGRSGLELLDFYTITCEVKDHRRFSRRALSSLRSRIFTSDMTGGNSASAPGGRVGNVTRISRKLTEAPQEIEYSGGADALCPCHRNILYTQPEGI